MTKRGRPRRVVTAPRSAGVDVVNKALTKGSLRKDLDSFGCEDFLWRLRLKLGLLENPMVMRNLRLWPMSLPGSCGRDG
ncbi:hypothetical protein Dimus_026165, partial [Dionaea muscipula]